MDGRYTGEPETVGWVAFPSSVRGCYVLRRRPRGERRRYTLRSLHFVYTIMSIGEATIRAYAIISARVCAREHL